MVHISTIFLVLFSTQGKHFHCKNALRPHKAPARPHPRLQGSRRVAALAEDALAWPRGQLTGVQKLLDDGEVGVRHAVVQRRVAVAVGHVDHVAQHAWADGPERRQVVGHGGRRCRLLAGGPEPLVLHGVDARPLREKQTNKNKKTLV